MITVMWMAFIFSMSAQVGDDSSQLSRKVCKAVCYVVVDNYGSLDYYTQEQYIEKFQYPVRKLAHMTEYAILGILLMETFYTFRFDNWRKKRGKKKKGFTGQVLLCDIIGIAYACTDEYHQLYVSNRSGQIKDVIIDTIGLFAGITLALVVQKIKVWIIWRKHPEYLMDENEGPVGSYKEYDENEYSEEYEDDYIFEDEEYDNKDEESDLIEENELTEEIIQSSGVYVYDQEKDVSYNDSDISILSEIENADDERDFYDEYFGEDAEGRL